MNEMKVETDIHTPLLGHFILKYVNIYISYCFCHAYYLAAEDTLTCLQLQGLCRNFKPQAGTEMITLTYFNSTVNKHFLIWFVSKKLKLLERLQHLK